MTTTMQHHEVQTDSDGYMVDYAAWTPEIGRRIAADLGIELTPRHWEVINFAREDFASTRKTPGLRRISKRGGVPMKELYALFPKGPAKLIARIAGLPKPTSCL